MTVFYLIRHGEPTYKPVDERNFIGHGRDLASLTEKGIEGVKEKAKDNRLDCFDLCDDFNLYKGIPPEKEIKVWETVDSMTKRMQSFLKKYIHYKKVIVVCHGMVIRTVKNKENIGHAEIIKYSM